MRNGEVKFTFNVVYLAFLIRHSYITAGYETDPVQICFRLHRRYELFIA